MPIDFPACATPNTTYATPNTKWVYDGTRWVNQAQVEDVIVTTVSATAPVSPADGDLWFDSDDGTLYVWYDAGAVWVANLGEVTVTPAYTPVTSKSVIWKQGSDYTTTSTTLAVIDDTNLPISVDLEAGDVVELSLVAPWAHSNIGSIVGIDWNINQPMSADTTIAAIHSTYAASIHVQITYTDFAPSTPMTGVFVATEDGTHTFSPRWRTSGGTARIEQDGTYATPIYHTVKVSKGA
jgi:hypothetical protein